MTGVERVAHETVRALDTLAAEGDEALAGLSVTLAVPPGVVVPPWLRHLAVREVPGGSGLRWEQWALRRAAGDAWLVNLCNMAPLARRRQIVLIHDVATVRSPASYSRAFRAWYALAMPLLYRRSAGVATVSQFSRDELRAVYGPRDDVEVWPEGTDHMARLEPDPSVLERHDLGPRPFVLAVGSMAVHKNFGLIVQALQRMDNPPFDLVVAGGRDPRIFGDAAASLPAFVRHVGYVSDEQLKALYQRAACFVFPSTYEGYGLPPTEAMACGCPVLAARVASMPEVLGDAAAWFDPRDAQALAALMHDIVTNPARRQALAQAGAERAERLRWRGTALALLACARRLGGEEGH